MTKNILGKLTSIALLFALALLVVPAATAPAMAAKGKPAPYIPPAPDPEPDGDEIAAAPTIDELAAKPYPVWVYSQFYPIWLPMYGWTVWHCRLAVWWLRGADGRQHTITLDGTWEGTDIDGNDISVPIYETWTYTNSGTRLERTLIPWSPPALLKEASVEVYVYFDDVCIPDYCPYQDGVNYNRVIKLDTGSSNVSAGSSGTATAN
jgi:hypothetical protein